MSNSAAEDKPRNYLNGYSKKTVKTQLNAVEVKVPRDRNVEYEPQIISKHNRNTDGVEEKIPGLYTYGMSQRDISEQIKNLCNVEISPELVSKISEKILPEVTTREGEDQAELFERTRDCSIYIERYQLYADMEDKRQI